MENTPSTATLIAAIDTASEFEYAATPRATAPANAGSAVCQRRSPDRLSGLPPRSSQLRLPNMGSQKVARSQRYLHLKRYGSGWEPHADSVRHCVQTEVDKCQRPDRRSSERNKGLPLRAWQATRFPSRRSSNQPRWSFVNHNASSDDSSGRLAQLLQQIAANPPSETATATPLARATMPVQ